MTEPRLGATLPGRDTVWVVVRDAVRGVRHDYTAGSIGRAIVLLAIPMVLEMGMESIFAVVDVFWVSRLGPDAVATVGLTESMLTLVYTAAQGIALGLVVAAVVAVLGVTLAPRLLAVMGASPAVTAIGSGYTRMML